MKALSFVKPWWIKKKTVEFCEGSELCEGSEFCEGSDKQEMGQCFVLKIGQ